MAILTTINGIPLYSTSREADEWAKSKGITGIHTHSYRGQTGYMGGLNHEKARNPQQEEQLERQQEDIRRLIVNQRDRETEEIQIEQVVIPIVPPTPTPSPTPTPPPTPPASSGGSSGGGGGY